MSPIVEARDALTIGDFVVPVKALLMNALSLGGLGLDDLADELARC